MAVLTETFLRSKWKEEKFTAYHVRKNTVITPSARGYLKEIGVELIIGDEMHSKDPKHMHRVPHPVHEKEATSNVKNDPKRYKNFYTDEYYSEKPESMTQIKANLLVFKDDPRIIFRGRIDSLEAEFLRGLLLMKYEKNADLFQGVKDIYLYIRKIMRAEVLGETVTSFSVLGKDYEEIRKITHRPSDYFSGGHLVLTGEEKPSVIHLNVLRTSVREVEIVAVSTFRKGTEVERNDIIESLNRLSSALYYLMLVAEYGNGQ